jgi:hypothetical protein
MVSWAIDVSKPPRLPEPVKWRELQGDRKATNGWSGGSPQVVAPSDIRSIGHTDGREVSIIIVDTHGVNVHRYREFLDLGLLQTNNGDALLLDDIPYSAASRTAVEAASVPYKDVVCTH